MTYICNDQLTRIANPATGKNWKTPKTYRVGDIIEKNGMKCPIRAFGAFIRHSAGIPPMSAERPRCVYAVVKYPKVRGWVSLFIGDTNSFQEKLVFGTHKNPVFNR